MKYNIKLFLYHKLNMESRAKTSCRHPSHAAVDFRYHVLLKIVDCAIKHKEITCEILIGNKLFGHAFIFEHLIRVFFDPDPLKCEAITFRQ